jgi:glutathione peroxidase
MCNCWHGVPEYAARRACVLSESIMFKSLIRAVVLLGLVGVGAPALAAPSCPSLLDRQMPRLQDEKPQNLCQYSGQVLLVVNTASFCGFTPQYTALEALYARLKPKGLVVLGFPSNDFAQEPGTGKDIAELCENTYGVKFPMFTKSRVSASAGSAVNPLFADLAKRTGQPPKWNFHKYLVARDGVAVSSFTSEVDPMDPAFVRQVEKLLDAK